MGNNVKKLTEKSLKAFLKKKKVGFTVALITAFMITGGLTLGSTAELQTQVEITHQELLDKIVSQKMEIEQMIKDNEDKLWKLKSEQMSRVREGDWYSKPWYPSYFGSLIGWYESSDNVGKDWKGSIRGDTRMDKTRLVFDEALYKVAGGYLSSGWINNTKAYDENTNVYDYEDKIIILPVVRVPELTKPVVPTVAITMPATPAKVNTPIASVPTISPIDVTIVTPSVVPPSAPGTINVVAPTLTPIVVNDPGINPVAPNIVVNPAEPVFSITPNTPGFSMAVKEVGEIPTITVVPPSVDPDLPVPNASPFTDFQFQPSSNADTSTTSQTNTGRILYSGYNPTNSPIGTVLSNTIGDVSIKYGINGRMPAVTYLANNSAGSLTGGTYYIAGGNAGTYNAKTGQIGIHIVWNATIKNVTGHLYGKAAFISVETWHGGKITLDNVTISTIKNQDNTIFYIYPAGYQAINTNHNAHNQRGEFSGTINATIQSNRNSIYVQSGISGSYKIESKGTYILEGFGNTVYSGLGYSPDYSKLSGVSPDGITYGQINGSVDMKPSLQFITAPESYGDENVIIFFNTKMNTASLPAIYNGTGTIATDIKPFIGFYQGQIFASAKIGEKLSTITSSTKQDYGNISGNSDVYVDSNVGIYSKSGQREEIATNADLGAPDRNPSTMADYKLDSIHNLEIGQIDIKFGKFSKNGVMIASENGTVIDIAKEAMGITSKAGIDQLPVVGTTTLKYSSWFSDGTDKIATTEANASINTIIAYASGAFSNTIHGLGTVIGTTLDGKGSEINIHIPLGMVSHGGDTSSEYAIAYFAKEGGIINQKSTTLFNDGTTLETATTVARGYKSIIAYADGTGSIVDVDGSIKAVDGNVSLASNKYQNIGAFASSGGEIVVTGKAEINGIGALADGNNSKVEMENTLNIVNSGLKGAVVAMNNGLIEFVGTINHGVPGAPGDYSEIVPFYADSTGKIDFTGTTTINMYKGILLEGTMVDYSNASSTSAEITAARYNDMQNVSVVLQASGVNLGVFDNFAATYDTEVSYLTSLALFAKLGSLTNAGTYTYDSFLIDGTLNVTTNGTISLDSNPFKNITMQNEVVTFSSNTTITSAAGNGLSIGSNTPAVSNATSGYINNGTIDISGGTNPVAVYVSFGKIENNGQVTVANGVAMAGVNGSKLINNSTKIITVTSTSTLGEGIVGLSRRIKADGTPDDAELSGIDAGKSGKSIEIENYGIINAIGTDAIGIYAENNTDVDKDKATVLNSGKITVGNRGTGVMVTNTKGSDSSKGVQLTLTGTGASDIITGTGSIGVYAKNSEVVFTSNYGIEVKEGSVGIYTIGNFGTSPSPASIDSYLHMPSSNKLTLTYIGNVTGNAAALYYDNDLGQNLTSPINIELKDTIGVTTGVIAAIVAKDNVTPYGTGTLTNSGNITSTTGGVYGIVSSDVDIVNTGTIAVGIAGGKGGTAIFATRAGVSTDGSKITVVGDNAIGIYAVNKSSTTPSLPALSIDKVVSVTGTGTMNINDKNSIGIFVKDTGNGYLTLNNVSPLVLNNSITAAGDRVIGIALENSQGGTNKNRNTGTITVNSYNVGIYLNNSNIINNSTINISSSLAGIGIFAEGAAAARTIELNGSTFNVSNTGTANTDIPLGVFVKGNNITVDGGTTTGTVYTVGPNAIGNFLTGNDTSTTTGNFSYSLSSNITGSNEKIAIGAFYTGGAFGNTGTVTLSSTATATDSSGNKLRPIGLFYGTASTKNASNIVINGSNELIGMYGSGLTFANSGTITINTKSIGAYFTGSDVTNGGAITIASNISNGYGLYFDGNKTSTGSSNNASIIVNGAESIGIIATNSAVVTNTSAIDINSTVAADIKSVGAYAEESSTFTNSGTITVNSSDGIGTFAVGTGTIGNSGTIKSKNVSMYGIGDGTDGATVNNSGTIEITYDDGAGVMVIGDSSTAYLTDGDITDGDTGFDGVLGAVADETGIIYLNGTDITLKGDESVGISLLNSLGTPINASSGILTAGNIEVGEGGIAIYGEGRSTLDISGYNILNYLKMGNQGIGIYADNITITTATNQKLNIDYAGALKGVGIYYTNITGALTNNIEIIHSSSGKNLVHIFSDGISNLTNTANQTVLETGIGIFAKNSSIINNQGNFILSEDGSVGIYLDSSTLTNIGSMSGVLSDNKTGRVGVYVKDSDITGSSTYDFDVRGGIGMYLANTVAANTGTGYIVNYTGDINVMEASPSAANRTIGVYVSPTSPVSGKLGMDIIVTGEDAIGLYLASDTSGTPAADIIYDGEIKITSNSSGIRGLGAYLGKNTKFTLGTTGIVTIGGINNIGFYASAGADFNILGGTVTNTVDGIFAYIANANLTFNAALTINYANIIVDGTSATMTNNITINVGNGGLQGSGGATITNGTNGVITGTDPEAKGMIGTGTGTTLLNSGNIVFTDIKSVGIYVEDGAIATSNGNVTVGDESVAYYSGYKNGPKGKITINGTTTIGEKSSIMYADGGDIDYKAGDITVGNKRTAITIKSGNSIVDLFNSNINVNSGGVGVYVTGTGSLYTGITRLNKLLINNNGVGIYLDNHNILFSDNQAIELNGDGAIGIFAGDASTADYIGTILGTAKEVKAIVSIGAGIDATNSGNINLTGDSGIGIYGENANLVENTIFGNITIAKGTTSASSVGIYGKNSTTVSNAGLITIVENSVGIYGENSSIINTGTLTNTIGHSTGIFGKNSTATNNGNITFGDMSNGIFVQDGTIENNNNVTVGNGTKTVKPGSNPVEYDIKASVGLYGGGNTNVYHNNGALITTGNYGVGMVGETGYIETRSGSNFNLGEESIYMYTDNGTGSNYTTLTLSDYSVGMYANIGSLTNEAIINVGKSSVLVDDVKISVGMATGTNTTDPITGKINRIGGGTVKNNGTINVSEKNGVGMIANNPTGTAINNSVINVTADQAYGMEGSEESTIINDVAGEIYITGTGSRGMAATTGTIVINRGLIQVEGAKSEGIYVDKEAEAHNFGEIIVNGAGNYGIYVGQGGIVANEGTITLMNGSDKVFYGGGTIVNVGKITIDSNRPTVSMDGVTIANSGVITVNGALDFGTISIGGTDGYIGSINADTFEGGEIIVLPTLTQGNNETIKIVQYLNGAINVPNNGALSAISHSVSWLADIQSDPNNPNIYRVVMVKIPYVYLFDKTPAVELGRGLDEIYSGALDRELQMFDAIDLITDKDELGAVMDMEIRGNIYANLQERMLEINDTFDGAFEKLRHDRLYTKESLKIGAIMTGGKVKDSNPAIENYDYSSIGVMILKEYDQMKFGRKLNWSVGFAQTKFDFDNDSLDTVYSLNLGIGYEDYIGNNSNLKWHSRAEISINYHDTDRKIHLSNGIYENNGKFWSAKGMWTNKIRYDIPIESDKIKAGVYGALKLGYGKYEDFKETGDGMRLHVKSGDMYFLRPEIGGDIAFTKYLKRSKIVLTAKASYEYELGKIHNGANQAKIRDTNAGYYDLEKPKDVGGVLKVGVELKYETIVGHSIGVEIIRKEGKVDSTRIGLNLLYRFK